MAGDDDLVTLDHTVQLYRWLADGELAVLPRASHLLLLEHPDEVVRLVERFLAEDAVTTLMPFRRSLSGAR
jgi:pimeloyl-ACP methyl ester carboxylesterase